MTPIKDTLFHAQRWSQFNSHAVAETNLYLFVWIKPKPQNQSWKCSALWKSNHTTCIHSKKRAWEKYNKKKYIDFERYIIDFLQPNEEERNQRGGAAVSAVTSQLEGRLMTRMEQTRSPYLQTHIWPSIINTSYSSGNVLIGRSRQLLSGVWTTRLSCTLVL